MSSRSSLERLIDTADLLRMLEQLVDGLSRGSGERSEVAWGGIGTTLGQCRKNILQVSRHLHEEGKAPLALPQEDAQRIPSPRNRSSLASRVQRVPTSNGTVRELRESPFDEKPSVTRHQETTTNESLERTAES